MEAAAAHIAVDNRDKAAITNTDADNTVRDRTDKRDEVEEAGGRKAVGSFAKPVDLQWSSQGLGYHLSWMGLTPAQW